MWSIARRRLLSTHAPIETIAQFESMVAGLTSSQVLTHRNAVIYAPAPSVMQQASRPENSVWILKFEPLHKWSNPLMGWTATRDPVSSVRMKFESQQAAVEFAKAQGIPFRVQEAHVKSTIPKSYSTNFKWKGPPK